MGVRADLVGSVDRISFDLVFLQGLLGAVSPCAWPLPVAAIVLALAGGKGQAVVRNRLLAYAAGFVVAFTLLHLYGTPLAAWLERHRLVGALALAFLLAYEGLFLFGVKNIWARLRAGRPGADPASDATTAAILGLLMPFAVTLCTTADALSGAASLGDAGAVPAAAAVVLAAALGAALALLALGHVAYLLSRAVGRPALLVRIAGAVLVVMAVLIALGGA